jgi:hypothetical protein
MFILVNVQLLVLHLRTLDNSENSDEIRMICPSQATKGVIFSNIINCIQYLEYIQDKKVQKKCCLVPIQALTKVSIPWSNMI